jgi:outer membrane protease
MDNPNIQIVEKEEVSALHFPTEEILASEKERKSRAASIERAISLGNLEHHKVRIYFTDDQGEKRVDTTIWAVTDSAIVLKQHTILPINRILKLEI